MWWDSYAFFFAAKLYLGVSRVGVNNHDTSCKVETHLLMLMKQIGYHHTFKYIYIYICARARVFTMK